MLFTRIIGLLLIVMVFIAIQKTYSEKERMQERFEAALENPIIGSDQIPISEIVEVDTTYAYSHRRIIIRNAERNHEPDATTHLTVKFATGEEWELVYRNGSELTTYVYKGPLHVSKNKEFDGEIKFYNFACGCENFGPSIFYYGSLAIGLILAPIGLFLTLRRSTNMLG